MPNIGSIKKASTLIFLVCVISFPRSYLSIKLICLAFFMLTHFFDVYRRKQIIVYPRLITFYTLLGFAGALWSLLGAVYGAHEVGISDSFRLYVIWSMAFLIIFTFLRTGDEIKELHTAIILAGIVISFVNFYALYDTYFKIGLITPAVREELELGIGIHEGYIRMNAHNIGSLFIVTPYLLSLQFLRRAEAPNAILAKVSLILCLVLTGISGRRALWIVIACTPFIAVGLSAFSGGLQILKRSAKRFICLYSLAAAIFAVTYALPDGSNGVGSIAHLKEAFSAEDERSIQKTYLLQSFGDAPILGSGLGASAIVPRNSNAPWLYEATYFQMLFNLGILGTLYLVGLFGYYTYLLLSLIKANRQQSAIPFCFLVSLLSLFIGAYSNPYLASFDFLIYVGILPFLTTYRQGFRLCHIVDNGMSQKWRGSRRWRKADGVVAGG